MSKENNVRKLQSKKERNLEMYKMYLEGIPFTDIAEQFGMSPQSVKNISCKEKWAERKFTNATEAIEIFNTKFINTAEQLIEEFYANDKYAYRQVIEMLKDPNCYMSNGVPSIYKLRQIVETMVILEDRLKDLTGIVPASDLLQAKIKAIQYGMTNEDDVIEDNFLQALGFTATQVFGDNKENMENDINKYTSQSSTKNPKYED